MENQTVFIRPPVWAILAAVVLGGCFYVYGKHLETYQRTPSTINVSGDGKAFAAPDIATMNFGVQVPRQVSAKQAMDKLATQMSAVLDAVKASGIDAKDIQTQQLSLNPAYDYSNGSQKLQGYEASQTLLVKVRNLDKTSDVLAAATNAGANQAGDVQFTMDDPSKLQAQARAEAITEAQGKARELAKQLGVELGELKGFSENGNGATPPRPYAMEAGTAMKADAVAAPPIPQGQQEVDVTVTLTYELE
jgi:uncharacterized protein YggE